MTMPLEHKRQTRDPTDPAPATADAVERGRACCAQRAWADAWHWLSLADGRSLLGATDLQEMATVAYLLGRDDDYLSLLERAHASHLAANASRCAVRCAFLIGLRLAFRGETGRAGGWFARAHRCSRASRTNVSSMAICCCRPLSNGSPRVIWKLPTPRRRTPRPSAIASTRPT